MLIEIGSTLMVVAILSLGGIQGHIDADGGFTDTPVWAWVTFVTIYLLGLALATPNLVRLVLIQSLSDAAVLALSPFALFEVTVTVFVTLNLFAAHWLLERARWLWSRVFRWFGHSENRHPG